MAYHNQFSRASSSAVRKYRKPSSSSLSRKLEPQEETFEEQEARADKEISPTSNISSSFPDEAVMPSPPSLADNFKQFQYLTRRAVESVQIPLKEIEELNHKLLGILHNVFSALPVNEVLLDPANVIWHALASIPPKWKRAVKNHYVPSKESELLFY